MSVQYHPKDFKTILNKLKFIDSWFWCRYTLNPYNGCEFACTYCDSRSHNYPLHPDFDQQIFIKTNIGRTLEARILEWLKVPSRESLKQRAPHNLRE